MRPPVAQSQLRFLLADVVLGAGDVTREAWVATTVFLF
jgi:hypothetical protein